MSLSSRSLSVGVFILGDNKFTFGGSKKVSSTVLAVLSIAVVFLGSLDFLLRTSEFDLEKDAVFESAVAFRESLSGDTFIGGGGVESLSFVAAKSHSSSNFWQLPQTGCISSH